MGSLWKIQVHELAANTTAALAVRAYWVRHFMAAIEDRLVCGRTMVGLSLDAGDGQGLHWLYEYAEVMARRDEEGVLRLTVRVAPTRSKGQAALHVGARRRPDRPVDP